VIQIMTQRSYQQQLSIVFGQRYVES